MIDKYEHAKVPSGPSVCWEKWVDAYDNEENDIENEKFQSELEDIDFEMEPQEFVKPIKSVMTPFGILPLTEQSQASKHFRFWVGHTNFRITQQHLNMIDECEGVETVDILTPYRFRIAIGILFSEKEVRDNLKSLLVNI